MEIQCGRELRKSSIQHIIHKKTDYEIRSSSGVEYFQTKSVEWYERKEKKRGTSIVVKELESIDQDCLDNADLPAGIRDGAGRIGAHESGPINKVSIN